MAAHEGQKAEGGGEQLPQSQPEGLQYLLPPDAAGNNAAALAALLQANQATGEAAEFWRQRAGQLAGSGVDLAQLAANAANQAHIPGVLRALLCIPLCTAYMQTRCAPNMLFLTHAMLVCTMTQSKRILEVLCSTWLMYLRVKMMLAVLQEVCRLWRLCMRA